MRATVSCLFLCLFVALAVSGADRVTREDGPIKASVKLVCPAPDANVDGVAPGVPAPVDEEPAELVAFAGSRPRLTDPRQHKLGALKITPIARR